MFRFAVSFLFVSALLFVPTSEARAADDVTPINPWPATMWTYTAGYPITPAAMVPNFNWDTDYGCVIRDPNTGDPLWERYVTVPANGTYASFPSTPAMQAGDYVFEFRRNGVVKASYLVRVQ